MSSFLMIHVYKCWYSLYFVLCYFVQLLYFHKSLVKSHFKVIKEVQSFLFYLSMSIDNATWHARVDMFYALKPSLKTKSITTKFLEFFLLKLFFGITLLHRNNIHLFSSCIQIKKTKTKYYLRLLTKLSKMAKIAMFLFLWIPNLFLRWYRGKPWY